MEKFTARPSSMMGKSLTSYLSKALSLNHVNIKDICGKFSIGRSSFYHIDKNPFRVINIKKLSEILDKPAEQIASMTFQPYVNKLIDNIDNYILFNHKLPLINYKKRRFCPICLKEKGHYKLIWQVNEIVICTEHHCKIEMTCPICSREQPYLSDKLSEFKCPYCQGSIIKEQIIKVDEDIIISQERIYEDWNYLLNPSTLFFQFDGLSKEKSLELILLYIKFIEKRVYNTRAIKPTNNKVNRMIRSEYYGVPDISSLLCFLRDKSISISDFCDLINGERTYLAGLEKLELVS